MTTDGSCPGYLHYKIISCHAIGNVLESSAWYHLVVDYIYLHFMITEYKSITAIVYSGHTQCACRHACELTANAHNLNELSWQYRCIKFEVLMGIMQWCI